jgi:hypothetical protein
MTVDTAAPGRQFALLCYYRTAGGDVRVEWTYWPTREQAEEAERELTPCGPRCIGVHSAGVCVDPASASRHPAGRHRYNINTILRGLV